MLFFCFRRNVEGCHTLRRRLPLSTNSVAYQRLVSWTCHGPLQLSLLHLAVESFTAHNGARYWLRWWDRNVFLPHLHSTPPFGGFLSEYCHYVWYEKTRMVWLPDFEIILRIYTMGNEKRATRYSLITLINVGWFKKFFHCWFFVGLNSKFTTRLMSYFPPHLKCVPTLPCEIQKINNSNSLNVFNSITDSLLNISICVLLSHVKCSKWPSLHSPDRTLVRVYPFRVYPHSPSGRAATLPSPLFHYVWAIKG